MTYDGVDIGEAIQPIQDRVESFQSNGYAIVSPGDALSAGAYAVTVGSGDLNASDTLSVGSSNDEILFDGSTKSLSSATNITINGVSAAGDGTEQYRYDVIYADVDGEVQKTEGSVTKLDSRESQNNLTRFERFKGAIPNPGTDPSVIIAAVIVNSNDTSVSTSQLRDYRVSATHKVSALEANNVYSLPNDIVKLLNIDPDEITAWENAGGNGIWPDSANDVHFVRNKDNDRFAVEYENIGSDNVDHYLEAQSSASATYGIQEGGFHHWAWGGYWDEDTNFRVYDGWAADPTDEPFLEYHKDGNQHAVQGHGNIDARERIGKIRTGAVSSFSESVTNLEFGQNGAYYVIELLHYADRENAENNELQMTVEGVPNGTYEYTLEDETLATTTNRNEDQWSLVKPTASGVNHDNFAGEFRFKTVQGRPVIFGEGIPAVRAEGQTLSKGWTDNQSTADPFDVTFSASTVSDSNVELELDVWEIEDRNNIRP